VSWFDFQFEAPLERHGVGRTRKVWYTVLFLPAALAAKLPFDQCPQLRFDGEIGSAPVNSAFISSGDGRYYCIVSPQTVRVASVTLGDVVEVRFRLGNQNHVDVPDALQSVLSRNRVARSGWNALTPGRRRALAHHVNSTKTASPRDRRVAAVVAALTGRIPKTVSPSDVAQLDRMLGKRSPK
jgi:hypothetical protein